MVVTQSCSLEDLQHIFEIVVHKQIYFQIIMSLVKMSLYFPFGSIYFLEKSAMDSKENFYFKDSSRCKTINSNRYSTVNCSISVLQGVPNNLNRVPYY